MKKFHPAVIILLSFISLVVHGQASLPINRTTWNGAEPTGWTNTGGGTMLDPFACTGDNAGWFNANNTSRTVFYNGPATQLVMKLKKDGIPGMSQVEVQQSSNGSSWTTTQIFEGQLGGIPFTDCADLTVNLSTSSRYVRWNFLKGSGNIVMDDVRITNTAAAPVSIWENAIVGTNPSTANPFTSGQIVAANLAVSGIGRGSGIAANAGTDRYNANGWNSASLNSNDYFSFTLTAATGYRINFSSFQYTGETSPTGPVNFALRSSVDGYTANIGTATANGTTIDLSGASYQGLTNVTYRLYAWGASASGGTFSVNDFLFMGEVTNIPNTITTGTVTGAPFTIAACGNTASGTVAFTSTDIFTNNTYTAQLSNASGSFASPTVIGTLVSNANSGTINITIPVVPSGTGYKIRVVSSSPVVTGTESAAFTINSPTCNSSASDHFRTRANGNWTSTSTWETSANAGGPWIPATLTPTSASSSITILSGHTVNVTSTANLDQAAVFGILEIGTAGALSIQNGSGDDLTVENGGIIRSLGTANGSTQFPTIASCVLRVKTGGKIQIGIGSGIAGGGYHIVTQPPTVWESDAVFEWDAMSTFASSNITFFDPASSNKPIFRISAISGNPGASNPTSVYGILELDTTVVWTGSASKIFRDGIRGLESHDTLKHLNSSAGAFNVTAAGAILDGNLSISLASPLNLQNNTEVPLGAEVFIRGTSNITNNTTSNQQLVVNGTLDVTDRQITNTIGQVIVHGTYRTTHAGGFSGGGSSIPSGLVSLNPGTSTIEYYASANQAVTTRSDYYNLTLSGSGTKSTSSGFTPAGTVYITGTAIFDCTGDNVGGASTNLVMDGGRLIVSTTGTQPSMGGTYSLTDGVVQFAGSNMTSETIRNKTYQHIEVTGSNVANSSGNITLNSGGSFTVKTGGSFTINDNSITGPTGTQTVTVEAGGTFRSGNNQGFSGYTATFTDNSSIHQNIENIVLAVSSTVEYIRTGNQPITVGSTWSYGNLHLTGTGNKTAPNGTLQIKGNFTGDFTAHTFVHNSGTVLFSGTTSQTYTTPGYTFYNIINSNTTMLDINSELKLVKKLSMEGNAKLNVGSFFRLLSSDTATASIGKITLNNAITYGGMGGRFVVERYIATGTTANHHSKAWQFLAVPTFGLSQTVKAAWQEGAAALAQNPNPGYGTMITGHVPGNGFDIYTPAGPSMKTFDPVTMGWVGIPNTDMTTIANAKGYMLMVRGDRTVTTSNGTPTPTILRTEGKIYSPGADAPYTSTISAGSFQSVGNPYASAIDFKLITKSGSVDDVYYVWDPRLTQAGVNSAWGLGAYQTFTWNGSGYDVTPGGGSYASGNYYLQSGQAFIYHSAGAGGTLTFTENCKVDGDDLVTRPGVPYDVQQLRTSIYAVQNNIPVLIDGVRSQFDAGFNNAIDGSDARKISNTGENFGILRHGIHLSVERRELPGLNDTIHFNLGQTRVARYALGFTSSIEASLRPVLVDRFLQTSTRINAGQEMMYEFDITSNPASAAANRFYIVFRKNAPVQITMNGKTRDEANELSWSLQNSDDALTVELMRSTDGRNFSAILTTTHNGVDGSFDHRDERIMTSAWYRVDAITSSGRIQSNVVKLERTSGLFITVAPNPVKEILNIQYKNLLPGNYDIAFVSADGRVVFKRNSSLGHSGRTSINLPAGIRPGVYSVIISGEGTRKEIRVSVL